MTAYNIINFSCPNCFCLCAQHVFKMSVSSLHSKVNNMVRHYIWFPVCKVHFSLMEFYTCALLLLAGKRRWQNYHWTYREDTIDYRMYCCSIHWLFPWQRSASFVWGFNLNSLFIILPNQLMMVVRSNVMFKLSAEIPVYRFFKVDPFDSSKEMFKAKTVKFFVLSCRWPNIFQNQAVILKFP